MASQYVYSIGSKGDRRGSRRRSRATVSHETRTPKMELCEANKRRMMARPRSLSHPELECFGDRVRADLIATLEIGDRAGDLPHPVVAARGERQPPHCRDEQAAGGGGRA